MSQQATNIDGIAQKYTGSEVETPEEALVGARHIIAEWISERASVRNKLRWQLEKQALIESKGVKSKITEEAAQKYKDYFDWSENLQRCPSHRLLAILRAEKNGFVRVKVVIDNDSAISKIKERVIRSDNACSAQIALAIGDAYSRLLFPSLSNELLGKSKEKADDKAIMVFSKNLKQLLLGAPLGEKNILAIDPGYRTGCKVVCLNAQGGLEYNETIYPHPPKNDAKGAMKKISSLVDAYKIEAIAIGNGTASRETEKLIRSMRFTKDLQVFVVSEAG